jgi:SAM-dependent methyltransferase
MTTTETQTERRDALVERLFEAALGGLELFSVHLGWRLGLYETLASAGPLTAAELAERARIDQRYAREWLEQQAVASFLEVDDAAAGPDERRFALPEAHAEVLVHPDSPAFVTPFGPMLVGIAGALPEVVDAYRTGRGVPYSRYGPDFRDGQGAINRPFFVNELAGCLASVPEIHQRLTGDPPARVADVGCGQGASTIAIASAYPNARPDGLDLDEASIADATAAATAAGVGDRVRFVIRDAADLAAEGPYDLVCIFEALHDMARPVDALAAARSALAPRGSVLLADERVADTFVAPGDPVERMMFGWSVSHCLPSSREEQPSAALGTALRSDTVRDLAREAGFTEVQVLPIENDFLRFYRLVP